MEEFLSFLLKLVLLVQICMIATASSYGPLFYALSNLNSMRSFMLAEST